MRLSSPSVDGVDVYWLEGRPAEGGRTALVRWRNGVVADVTPAGANVRSRVHEYGGGSYLVRDRIVFYVEHADQRIYRLDPGAAPVPLTPSGPWRYADLWLDERRRRLLAVREEHVAGGEPIGTIVAIALDGRDEPGRVLVEGADFYARPRVSPDGGTLSWLSWRHPLMPWDGTELWTAEIDASGALGTRRLIAGGEAESIFQPDWSPDGALYFVSDRSGWWNLYRAHEGAIHAVTEMTAEIGRPLWQFDMSTWAWAGADRIAFAYGRGGRWQAAVIDVASGRWRDLPAAMSPGPTVVATSTHMVFVGQSSSAMDEVVRVDLASGALESLQPRAAPAIDARLVSEPEAISFPTRDGARAHALFYRPANPAFRASDAERPPLIVVAHGGPTDAASPALRLATQFWTSRGFAVVDVDYRGSSGYGRAYRRALDGQWGLIDVTDCIDAARHLVAAGEADPDRLVIRGSSAGGYTVLAALTFHPDVFKAGASYYGIGDLERLVLDTHKFEAHYLDTLVGPYPERRDRYLARSPIHHVDALSCPMILFQGLEDRAVPPDQARAMAAAVRAKGLPVSLLLFEGEQHGFRRHETIRRCLEAELAFYGVVFGFEPADDLPPLAIDNRGPGRR